MIMVPCVPVPPLTGYPPVGERERERVADSQGQLMIMWKNGEIVKELLTPGSHDQLLKRIGPSLAPSFCS